jgi:hypothetical protein
MVDKVQTRVWLPSYGCFSVKHFTPTGRRLLAVMGGRTFGYPNSESAKTPVGPLKASESEATGGMGHESA